VVPHPLWPNFCRSLVCHISGLSPVGFSQFATVHVPYFPRSQHPSRTGPTVSPSSQILFLRFLRLLVFLQLLRRNFRTASIVYFRSPRVNTFSPGFYGGLTFSFAEFSFLSCFPLPLPLIEPPDQASFSVSPLPRTFVVSPPSPGMGLDVCVTLSSFLPQDTALGLGLFLLVAFLSLTPF